MEVGRVLQFDLVRAPFHHAQGVSGRNDSAPPWDSPSHPPLSPFDTRRPIVAVAGQRPDQTSDRGLAKRHLLDVRTGCQRTHCHCHNPSALHGRVGLHG